jgi:hypothetical protein
MTRSVDIPEVRAALLHDEFGQAMLAGFFRGNEALFLEANELMFLRVDELGGEDAYWAWADALVPAEYATDEARHTLAMMLAYQWLIRRAGRWDRDATPPTPPALDEHQAAEFAPVVSSV